MHLVIKASETDPKRIRGGIKAWCTRRLGERCDPQRENWWAERGSQRHIFDEEGLATVMQYVAEAQDRKHLDDKHQSDARGSAS